MKSTNYIQPIIRMLLPPELHAFTDWQVWKAMGLHLISRIKDALPTNSL